VRRFFPDRVRAVFALSNHNFEFTDYFKKTTKFFIEISEEPEAIKNMIERQRSRELFLVLFEDISVQMK